MLGEDAYVRWFDELGSDDVGRAGGKNASLGELIAAPKDRGIRVPDGFATTAAGHRAYNDHNPMTQIVVFQFFHVLNARSFHRSIFRIPLSANPFLAISLPLALLAHVGVLYLPFMQRIFATEPLALEHWALVAGVGVLIVVAAEIDKAMQRRQPDKAR